ncbi:urease accessory protein UreD [Rothia sp. AR01]|uniref:Urease accessory protein UreD n=1 Tax=Rothia santali TaxID=2949643 RepID=A0A9X2HES5_9MICC|nr:urease accessory protein UreD [Rothia santali]MCP3426770.1 urease accessory protein UreD [Rothia santali]
MRLAVAARQGRSYAARQFHEGALRILRPHYLDRSGQVTYTVVNPGGAYLGADRYLIDVEVGRDASLALTTQSATKVYRTPQGPAAQDMTVRLGPGAVLEHLPDQLIVYRGGSYRQRTSVEMDPTSSLLLAEVVTPGWSPRGEAFAYDELRMRTEVRVSDPSGPGSRARRLVVDQLRIRPGEHDDVAGLGLMEGHSHTGQLLLADRRLDDELYRELVALVDASATRSGITRAGIPDVGGVRCVCIRSLADSTERIAALHRAVADALRRRWRGQAGVRLRKY